MAKTLLQQLQERMGGQYADDQRGLLEEYIAQQGYQKAGGQMVNELAEQPNLIPLAQDPYRGLRPIVDDNTLKSRVYDFVEPAMTHNIPEGRAENLLNWRNLVGGVADVVGKTIDKTQSPTFGDATIATAEIAGMGLPKIVSQYVKNLRNYVPGFYGGQEVLGAGRNAALGMLETTKDFARQFYKDAPISKGTENTLREEFANYQLVRLWCLVENIKTEYMKLMRDNFKCECYLGGDYVDGEGYVMTGEHGTYKLVNRWVFSHYNFNIIRS